MLACRSGRLQERRYQQGEPLSVIMIPSVQLCALVKKPSIPSVQSSAAVALSSLAASPNPAACLLACDRNGNYHHHQRSSLAQTCSVFRTMLAVCTRRWVSCESSDGRHRQILISCLSAVWLAQLLVESRCSETIPVG